MATIKQSTGIICRISQRLDFTTLQSVEAGRTLKNSDSRGEVVDTPGSADSCGDDGGRRDEIVGEAVVQVSLLIVSWCITASTWLSQAVWGDAGGVYVWCDNAYLELENIVDLVEFLLIPVPETQTLAVQLLISLMEPNGCRSSSGSSFSFLHQNPSTDASYLAVNSSKVSSACWSLFLAADCEKARWAVQAMGVAREAGARAPTRLTCDAERTKDIVRVN
jgi:hypothetical protein